MEGIVTGGSEMRPESIIFWRRVIQASGFFVAAALLLRASGARSAAETAAAILGVGFGSKGFRSTILFLAAAFIVCGVLRLLYG